MNDREMSELQRTGRVVLRDINIDLGALIAALDTLGIDVSEVTISPTLSGAISVRV